MKVNEAITAVMKAVGAVGKQEHNEQQGFNFRGVDTVVNAIFPALIEHGLLVVPHKVLSYEYGTVEIGRNRTRMGHVKLTQQFKWIGPEGDELITESAAEAMDVGDKATSKAHSVARRTNILETLNLPTRQTDPDAQTYERSAGVEPEEPQRTEMDDVLDELDDAVAALKLHAGDVAGKFYAKHKKPPRHTTAELVRGFIATLHEEAEKTEKAS